MEKRGNLQEALKLYDKAAVIDPESAAIKFKRAKTNASLGRYQVRARARISTMQLSVINRLKTGSSNGTASTEKNCAGRGQRLLFGRSRVQFVGE